MGKEFGARGGGGGGNGGGHHTEGLVVVGRLLECGTCPPSGELHYGLVMPYRPVRLVAGHLPIKAFSLSSSSSSPPLHLSPPAPSSSPSAATPSKDDASNGRWRHHHHPQQQHGQEGEEEQEATYLGGPVLWVVHGTPELPRPDYHQVPHPPPHLPPPRPAVLTPWGGGARGLIRQFSGGLEEFRVGECHRLRLKVKLDGPSPFDEVVDPYLAHPGQRYLCLKADLASPSGDDDDDDDDGSSSDDDSERQLDDDGHGDIEEEWEGGEDEDLDNANNSDEDDDEGDGDDSGMEEEEAA